MHFIILGIRFVGETKYLYIGRGHEFEGVFLSDTNAPSAMRCKDQYLEYLRKHLRNKVLSSIEIDEDDRAVLIKSDGFSSCEYFSFLWKARKLFFLHLKNDINSHEIFRSWSGKKIINPYPFKDNEFHLFNEVGRRDLIKKDIKKCQTDIEGYINHFSGYDKDLESSKTKKQKKLNRKKEKIEKDLIKMNSWDLIWNQLQSDEVSLEKVLLFERPGIKIRFNSEQSYYEKKSVIFDKVKRFKKNKIILFERLEVVISEIERIKKNHANLETNLTPVKIEWCTFKKAVQTSGVNKTDLIREYKYQNIKVGVGLHAQGNDFLRNKWSTKNDWWFHLDGLTSSHIVVRGIDSVGDLDLDFLSVLGSILRESSSFEGDQIPLLFTQVKNLKSVTGNAGSVRFKKEKRILVYFDTYWRKKITKLDS